jgi:hypothetical protein
MLGMSASRLVYSGANPQILGSRQAFNYWQTVVGFFRWGCHLRREDGSIVCNCCCSSPAQSIWGPSLTKFMNIFYCLRFETHPTFRFGPRIYISQGTRWPSYTPRHWVPFSSSFNNFRVTM